MSRLRRSPTVCEAPRCGRLAAFRLSNGPQLALACASHVVRYERAWGQVFVRGLATSHRRGRAA
jgi:hypothetical protein